MIESLDILLNLSLPAKDSYKLAVAANQLKERFGVYEQTRQNLVKKFGEHVAAENVIRVKNEHVEEFSKELEGLLSETVELEISPISVTVLGDTKLTAKDMAILSPFFCS